MSTQKLLQSVSGFTGGLNTEKSVLNILPSEMASGSINVDIDTDGSVRPRTGVDFVAESSNGGFLQSLRTESTGTDDTQESPSGIFVRFTASDNSLVDRVVTFMDNEFYIFTLTESALGTLDTPTQTITPASGRVFTTQRNKNLHFTFGDNKLFFCGDNLQFGYLSLNANDTDIDITYLEIRTRNLEETDYAQVGSRVKNTVSSNIYAYEAIVAHTSSSSDEPGVGANWEEYWVRLDIEPTAETAWATSTAYVANIVRRSKYDETLTANTLRPDAIWFWKSRLWIILGDRIYYSQVANRAAQYQNFYQAADPFNTNDPNPVEGDGGSFLSEGGKGLQLKALGNSMFFSTPTGVYEIRSAGVGFDHTNFSVTKVLNEEVQSSNAMVVAEDTLYLFGNGNIWRTIGRDSLLTDDRTVFESVGDNKIQDLYASIPRANKSSAYAVYNPSTRKIYWFHNQTLTDFDDTYRTIEGYTGYARHCLVLDVKVNRGLRENDPEGTSRPVANNIFSLWEYNDTADSDGAYIAHAFLAPPVDAANSIVLSGGDTVIDGSSNTVIASNSGLTEEANRKLYCIILQRTESGGNTTTSAAIGQVESGSLSDYVLDGDLTQSYTAKIFTGVQTYGDVLHNKATPYILFLFERLTNGLGSCLLRTAYNWSDSSNSISNKTSDQIEIYKESKVSGNTTISTENNTHTWYKKRVRGRGKSFQIQLESTPGKDFRLVGWAQQFYGKVD